MFEVLVRWIDDQPESIICDSFVFRQDYKMCILSFEGRSRTLHVEDIKKITIKELV